MTPHWQSHRKINFGSFTANFTSLVKRACMILPFFIPHYMLAQGIRVGQGVEMLLSGDVKLVLLDAGIVNYGSFRPGKSTVVFSKASTIEIATIGGNRLLEFNDLIINRPHALVKLENNINVSGTIHMRRGNLELNRYRLDLGRTGKISGENIQSFITGQEGGTIAVVTDLNRPVDINPGNIGVTISSAADLGATLIVRGHVQQVNADGHPGIHRYYEIRPAINTNANINIRFSYLDPELANNNESDLVVWSNTNAGSVWKAAGKRSLDAGNNWISLNEIPALNRFTLARDRNNGFSLSKTKTAWKQSNGKAYLQAYPNPARDHFLLAISLPAERESVISLQDQTGRTLQKMQLNLRAGLNTIRWNINRLAAGTYYVVFENPGLANLKIVKQ